MKVLHCAFISSPEPGILQQMSWEQESAKEMEFIWDVALCVPASAENGSFNNLIIKHLSYKKSNLFFLSSLLNFFRSRFAFVKWLNGVAGNYDVVLLRYIPSDFVTYFFLSSRSTRFFSVHHTLDAVEILSSGYKIKSFFKYFLNYFVFKKCAEISSGFVAVTPEIADYVTKASLKRKPFFVYPNGLSVKKETSLREDLRSNDLPEILFVASTFVPWHGLDLILKDVFTSNQKFILHLIGNIFEDDLKIARQDSRIVIHGVLSQAEIQKISSKCWVGLSSFALHRKGMRQACTLKVREYLENGLCIYSGHEDVFPSSFPYYKVGSPSIDDIIFYAKKMRSVSRDDVRLKAIPYINKREMLSSLYSWLKGLNIHA